VRHGTFIYQAIHMPVRNT